jgi:hypothetical protein
MDMFHTVQGSQESSGILEPYLYIKKDCGRCDGYVPHRARLRVCPSKDMVERSTTQSVEMETSSRWIECFDSRSG